MVFHRVLLCSIWVACSYPQTCSRNIKPFYSPCIKLIKKLARGREVVEVYYYNAPLDRKKDLETYRKQQKFFERLRKIPNFNLVLCRMQKVKVNNKTIYQIKEDDIHLAVDMIRLAYEDKYDVAVLLSADGDFVPAVQAVSEMGKKVENVGLETRFSHHLKQLCDSFKLLKKYEIIELFDDFKVR